MIATPSGDVNSSVRADRSHRRVRTVALLNETDGPGGAEVLLVQLAEELSRRHLRVVPVLPTRRNGWLHDRFEDSGFRPRTLDLIGARPTAIVSGLRTLLLDEAVDVAHSHELTMGIFGTAATGALRIPHVITFHGNQGMTRTLIRRMLLRWAIRSSSRVNVVSSATRQHLIETLGPSAQSVLTVPNGVPKPIAGNPDGPRSEFRVPSRSLLIVAVGSLHERKGHAVLLKALHRLSGKRTDLDWRLVIAGEGPEHENLVSVCTQLRLSDRVHLAGLRGDIPDLQAAADLFVMPSLWEGLPLAVLEGMFAGNPIVATRTSGIPEAITHGVEGLLVEPGDVEGLAGALERVLGDPALRAELGARALARAHADFTIERMTDDYLALYRAG